VLSAGGKIYAWGRDEFGQVGLGYRIGNWLTPRIFQKKGNDWVRIGVGDNHSLAIKSDGTLWAWGRNDFGQLGLGTINSTEVMHPIPVRVGTDTNWSAIAGGILFSVGLKKDGTLWGWGGNWVGQLGGRSTNLVPLMEDYNRASQAKVSKPTQIGQDSDWAAISVGGEHVLALKGDRSLWGWGRNDFGQLGDGTTNHRSAPVRIGTETNWRMIAAGGGFSGGHSAAIKTDGSLWVWGDYCPEVAGEDVRKTAGQTTPLRLGNENEWQSVSAGDGFTMAVKSNGTLWVIGQDLTGMSGKRMTVLKQISQINPGNKWLCAAAEGNGYYGGRTLYYSYALDQKGNLWVWGPQLFRSNGKLAATIGHWLTKLHISNKLGTTIKAKSPTKFIELGTTADVSGTSAPQLNSN
jgi:alpha-tubulin suppressor-like RCC1 family protein